MSYDRSKQIFNPRLALPLAIIISSLIGAWAYTHAKNNDQVITVTGSARKRIKSDLVIRRVSVSQEAMQVAEAFDSLKEKLPRIKAYLISKGVPENQIVTSSISTSAQKARQEYGQETNRIISYTLSQSVEVRSNDVDNITKISREVTELIDQGIMLDSGTPEYIYTKLGDLKIEMLAEAARDAKVRAQQIASNTGSRIGTVRSARMGVMQITPADSNEVSDSGMSDTSSLEKDITAVVNTSFAVD